jgi:hypothetical protein
MSQPRLHQFNDRHPCHFCGAAGPSTREHVPPRTFFDGTECSSITVPACSEHNSVKSGSDSAVKAALLVGVQEMISKGIRKDVPDSLRRCIQGMQQQFNRVRKVVILKKFISDHPDDQDLHLPFLDRSAQVDSWVRMLTSGLVWSVTGTHDSGCDWKQAWVWSPSYFPGRRNDPLTLDAFTTQTEQNVYRWQAMHDKGIWRPGWQPHPHSYPAHHYLFDICLDEYKFNSMVHFRHLFFGSHPYFVSVKTSEQTAVTIDRFLVAEADRRERYGIPPAPGPSPPCRPFRTQSSS